MRVSSDIITIHNVRLAVVYLFPLINSKLYEPMARRFANAYMDHPPGEADHELYVCTNGGSADERQERLFDPLVPKFISHNNSGKDIGAYMMAARTIPCDFLLCIGAPVRPRRAGWLDVLARAVEENGPGIYAPWGFHVPSIHLRTTIFGITPQILNAYPHTITNEKRYEFEWGRDCITLWCQRKGFQANMVTAHGVFPVAKFHHVPISESLFEDQHTDKYQNA